MSAPMKRPRTSQVAISIANEHFMVPGSRAAAILELVREYQVEENVPAGEVLWDVYKKYGKTGSVIRGLRVREDMTQIELARKLGVTQGGSLEDGERQASHREGDGPQAGKGVPHGLAGVYIKIGDVPPVSQINKWRVSLLSS